MKKLKISQIQFEAKATPVQNAILLKKYFEKTKKFKPDLICTPECSNIITNDKSYLLENTTYEVNCPIIKMSKFYAKENNINIIVRGLLLPTQDQEEDSLQFLSKNRSSLCSSSLDHSLQQVFETTQHPIGLVLVLSLESS